jgi:prepilin-type N-terminal cleavage/methylation domain-containing protein
VKARGGQRGFTLIELMVSLAVGATVATMIAGTMILFQQNSNRELNFTQAQQNARASLAILEYYLRQAGYGLSPSDPSSPVAVGACRVPDGISCDNVDAGSDRLRIASADASTLDGQPVWEPGGSMIRMQDKTDYGGGTTCPPGLAVDTKLVISAPCQKPPPDNAYSVLTIEKDVHDGQYCHKYQVSGSTGCKYDNSSGSKLLASAGYREVDFYIDRTDAAHPTLMMDPDGSGTAVAVPVAYDIEDLQVQYGVDTTPGSADRIVEQWCDQLSLASCNTGLADDRTNQSRVIAVRVAVVARTPYVEAGYTSPGVTVFGHPSPGNDGYARWVYRSVIRLRSINP